MITVLEAQQTIDQRCSPLADEAVALAHAHGRILRESVAAAEDIPGFDRSAMDGYAVRLDDQMEEFEVVGEIRAGQTENRALKPGQAIRIFTGARLPGDGLKVVMQEHVDLREGRIRVIRNNPNSNVRKRGEDARAGEVLLEPGLKLDATATALLASVGKTSVRVSRQPRILHLTTGDEIVPPDQTPADGQIRNSNASLIASLCREHGVETVEHYHTRDDISAMKELLHYGTAERYDLILISGGSGQGDYDFSADLFRHLGATIHFREINVRPGKPLIFGTTVAAAVPGGGCLPSEVAAARRAAVPSGSRRPPGDGASSAQIIFGLPGNALSHFVCFHLFVRRALDRLLARPSATPTQAVLSESMLETNNARETWWPAQARFHQGRLECRAISWKSSGDITRLPAANALIHVPASTSSFPAGAKINLLFTRNDFA